MAQSATHLLTDEEANAHPPLEAMVVRFAGDSGDGMQLTGGQFTLSTALAGNDLATFPDFPAEIRAPQGTTFGVSAFQINFGSTAIDTAGDQPDVLVAMNPAALKTNARDLRDGGLIIADEGEFTARNLAKAGYDAEPARRRQPRPLAAGPLQHLAADARRGQAVRARQQGSAALQEHVDARPRAVDVRPRPRADRRLAQDQVRQEARARRSQYRRAQRRPCLWRDGRDRRARLPPAPHRRRARRARASTAPSPAPNRSRSGWSRARSWPGLPMFFGGYPITPASAILHHLSRLKEYGITTFQAEDEIAAICAAIGASYAGQLGVTSSSGPGIALKTEAIGLAIMTELPLVIVNSQRGGPSTGLPTKTEQSDLYQAVYGRNGDAPLPVIAARSPADAFDCAIEACRIATRYMTPVMLLTDGYIANAAEPWKVPDMADYAPFPVELRARAGRRAGRSCPTRATPSSRGRGSSPARPGWSIASAGSRKRRASGNIDYSPEAHAEMTRIRAAKVDGIDDPRPGGRARRRPRGKLAIVGWGSTYGPIHQAVRRARLKGQDVSHIHIRHIAPLPANLGDLLRGFDQILVPEMNTGQLKTVLRDKYLVDARPLNKVSGQPFQIAEIAAAIDAGSVDGG